MTALAASNQRIRRLRRLSGRRSARADEGAFVIEGPVLVDEAIALGVGLEAVYVDECIADATTGQDLLGEDQAIARLLGRAREQGITVHHVAAGVLAGVTDSVTPRPILATAAIPEADPSGVIARSMTEGRHIVVLVDVRDPGNVGTIIRVADASGAVGVICTAGTVDPWSPKVVRSSAGAVLHVPVVTGVDIASALDLFGSAGIEAVGTVVADGTVYDTADLDGPVAFVLGNEAHGLSAGLTASLDALVTIPMEGKAESLNVAMAASVLCFEALRQRRRAGDPSDERRTDWTQPPTDDKVISP